jgi:hypothetical protein
VFFVMNQFFKLVLISSYRGFETKRFCFNFKA